MSKMFERNMLAALSVVDEAAEAERRDGPRHTRVMRVAKMVLRSHDELCVIRNISDGGLMAQVYSAPAPGEPVVFEFRSGPSIAGQVRWVRDDLIGVEFDTRIDAGRLLAGDDAAPVAPRAPRLATDTPAVVRCGVRIHPATLCDISQGGAKLCAADWTQPGQEVVVRVPGLPPIAGTIRWRDERHAGVAFTLPVPLPVLAAWAAHPDQPTDPA